MHEIEQLINELWNKLCIPPEECKCAGNSANRMRYIKIRSAIHDLVITKQSHNKHSND